MALKNTLLFLFCAATTLSAQKYPVLLSSPSSVGERYTITAKATKLEQISSGEKLVRNDFYLVNFEGTAEVLAVDNRRQATKFRFTVDRFTRTATDATAELLKPGSIIIEDGSQKAALTLDGAPLEAAALEAFSIVHSKHKPGDPTDDEVFGSKEFRSLGDTWQIDPEPAIAGLAGDGISVPPGHLSGRVTLLAKEKVGGTDCLSVRGEMLADGVSTQALPPETKLQASEIQATFRGCFPLARSGLLGKSGVDLDVKLHILQDGVNLDFHRATTYDSVWLPGATR